MKCVKCKKKLMVLEMLISQPYHILNDTMIITAALIDAGLLPLCFKCVNKILGEFHG